MRARLARYAHIQPSEFGRLTITRTRELNADIATLVEHERDIQVELAKMVAMSGGRI